MTITTEITEITPEMARDLLARNRANRLLSKSAVATFVGAIRRGEWQLTHQGVALDEDDNLLDGQHRLTAIVDSGATVPMMVTRGVPRATFPTLDQGHRRQAGQLLGIPHGSVVAAVSRRSMVIENPAYERSQLTTQMVFDHVDTYPEIHQAAAYAAGLNKARRLPGSLVGTVLLHALVSPYAAQVKDWVEELHEGVGLSADSPSRHLINRFSRQTARQIGEVNAYALTAKAWNAYALGRPVLALKVAAGETAPAIVGFSSRWEHALR